MKLSFPYMGPVLAYRKLLELVGHEVVMPQKPTQRTIDLGAKYSPEFLCFPFKCLLGTYIESIERGAEAIVTSGGDGSCRAGFYPEVHRRILKSIGYDVPFIVFDSLWLHLREFLGNVKLLKGRYSWGYVLRAVRFIWHLIAAMDRVEEQVRILRAHERRRGDFTRAWEQVKEVFDRCWCYDDVARAEKEAWEIIHAVPLRPWDPRTTVRVGIVGEIYVAMEGHANLEIEQSLAHMGVEVVNSQYVSHWLQHKMKLTPWQRSYAETIMDKATPYLKYKLGGHDKENIAYAIAFHEHHGVDGVIHLMPFACLPELVTQSIIPRVSHDLNMPILSLAMDEQRGNVNSQTRLEAFIDLLKSRKSERVQRQPA